MTGLVTLPAAMPFRAAKAETADNAKHIKTALFNLIVCSFLNTSKLFVKLGLLKYR
jgi:hypothetical protein